MGILIWQSVIRRMASTSVKKAWEQGGASHPTQAGQQRICAPGGGQQAAHPVRRQKKQTIQIGGATPFGSKSEWWGGLCKPPKIYRAFDDSHIPDARYFEELKRVAKKQVIFGGNYFLDHLGATECLIVWDKRRRGLNFADCEIAWTNIKQPCRIFEWKWNGMLQEDMANKEERIHPTQKPVPLYEWLINNFAKPGDTILDTHVGSASSLIACRNTGHKYMGFEIDKEYYEMAKKRLEAAEAQACIIDFLKPQKSEPEQLSFFGGDDDAGNANDKK